MAERQPATSLHVLEASASAKAVVVRRGPTKWWHVLLWDRQTGVVSSGSWFQGMLYPHRCDVSPKGDWMTILAYRGSKLPHAWTALCRPPSVHAVRFWPQESAKVGGGHFDGRQRVLWLNLTEEQSHQGVSDGVHPWEIGCLEADDVDRPLPLFEKLERVGWKRAKKGSAVVWTRKASGAELELSWDGTEAELRADESVFEAPRTSYRFRQADGEWIALTGASWVGFTPSGGLCQAVGGCLYSGIPTDGKIHGALVLDLNGLRPPERPVLSEQSVTP